MKQIEEENIFVKKKGAGAWIRRNGYYLLLVLSVGVIGAAAAIGLSGGTETPTQALYAPTPTPVRITTAPPAAVTLAPTEAPANAEPTSQPTKAPVSRFADPVGNGTLVCEFSADAPVYLSTLDQWSVHNGIDIAADAGTDVLAAGDGIVQSVETDVMMGTTVTLRHNDGLITEYACLGETNVHTGETVVTGSIIGKIGDSALRESKLGPHLHFAVMVSGVYDDPSAYLPGGSK